MKSRFKFSIMLIVSVMILLTLMSSVSAENLSVDGNFTNLNNNVSGSRAGDTIELTDDITLEDDESFTTGINIDHQLTIDGKGHTINAKSPNGNKATLFNIKSNANVVLKNLVITGAYREASGGAITVDTGSTLTLINCTFISNNAGTFGGAIYSASSDLTIDNCTFKNNTAKRGGAIYVHIISGTTKINMTGSVFENNIARNQSYVAGGVIVALENSLININKCIIERNHAVNGGAIYVDLNSTVNINNTKICNNTADEVGGGISVDANSTLIIENSTICHNTACDGGAIFASESCFIRVVNSTLHDNHAKPNPNHDEDLFPVHGYGGVIFGSLNSHMDVVNSTLFNNTGVRGGAIDGYINSTFHIENSKFFNNNATEYGGAISASNNASMIITNSTFNNNGAIGENSGYGGAIYANANSVINLTDSKFTENYAKGYGGAIYGQANAVLDVDSSIFDHNVAEINGGAIRIYQNATLNATDSVFVNNRARYGAAIAGYENSTVKINNSKFVNSSSGYYGGSVSVSVNSTMEISGSEFINCTAGKMGGALALNQNATANIIGTNFTGNKADDIGGAIATSSNVELNIAESNFKDNHAGKGGAIYGSNSSDVDVDNSKFVDNSADSFGASIYNEDSMTLSNSEFTNGNDKGFSEIYLTNTSGGEVKFDSNVINSSNLIPIYNNGSMIVSPTKLVVMDNKTHSVDIDENVDIWANLYDDNNNLIGSSVPVVIDVKGIKSDLPAAFNENKPWNFETATVVDKHGSFPVTGSYANAANVEVLNGLLRVKNTPTNISVVVDNKKYNQTVNGTITLTDNNGHPISGIVNVTIVGINSTTGGYWTKNVTVSNGKAEFTVDEKLNVNNYTVTVKFDPAEDYMPSTNSSQFEISKINSTVSISLKNATYGENIIGEVTVEGGLNGTATVTIGNSSYDVPVVNGVGSLNIKNTLPAGYHPVKVEYSGDINHFNSTNDTVLYVDKIKPSVSINVEQTKDYVTIFVKLPSDINENVTITVNGKDHIVQVVNGTGKLVLKNLPNGNYLVIVKYFGNDKYWDAMGNSTFTVSHKHQDDKNHTNNNGVAHNGATLNMDRDDLKTGNPIWLLLLALIVLPLRRRFKK